MEGDKKGAQDAPFCSDDQASGERASACGSTVLRIIVNHQESGCSGF